MRIVSDPCAVSWCTFEGCPYPWFFHVSKKRIMRNSSISSQVQNKIKPKICISPQLKNLHVQGSSLEILHMAWEAFDPKPSKALLSTPNPLRLYF